MNSVRLKNLSKKISSGLTPSRANSAFWSNGSIDWLKTDQLKGKYVYETTEKISQTALDKTSISLFPINTLSIAMYGEGKTRGNVSILKKIMATNQACCNIVLDPAKADSEYVYYYLKTQYNNLRWLSSGVRKNLNSNDIKEFLVTIPDTIVQQQKIAAVLSALDDKIELNRRINTELEQMARTLYDYWFVQFDFPGPDGKPYKSSGGKMTYNDQLKREIPTGWKVCELQERCTSYLGGTPSRKNINYWNSNDIAWLSSGEVANFPIIDSEEKISKDGLRNSAAQLLDKGSVMISITGNIRVSILGIDASANQSVVGITPTEEVSSEYLYLYISRLVPKLEAMMTGAVQKHINKKVVDEIQLLVPEQSILREFDSIVKPMYEKILVNSQESQKLAHLRDWLLPMLMNGQVTIQGNEADEI